MVSGGAPVVRAGPDHPRMDAHVDLDQGRRSVSATIAEIRDRRVPLGDAETTTKTAWEQ